MYYVRAVVAALGGGLLAGFGAWAGTGRSAAVAIEGGLVAVVLLMVAGGYVLYAFTAQGEPRPGRGGVRTAVRGPVALTGFAVVWFALFAFIGLALRH